MVIYITGLPGAGKSTVGRKLEENLNYQFLDYDQEIPQEWNVYFHNNKFVPDELVKAFFPVFINKLKNLHEKGNLVVAVTVGFEEHAQMLQEAIKDNLLIRLKAGKNILMERVRNREHFFSPELLEQVFDSKYDISYSSIIIDASGSIERVVNECLELIRMQRL